ncbi:MAG: DUF1838 domain-containing protein [Cyanobacteria bacterium J06639_14]
MSSKLENFGAAEWVKVRNSTQGEESLLTWHGSVYALIPNEKKTRLFNLVGMSISRCIDNGEGGWDFMSRELVYYLDPETNAMVQQWHNPWTDKTVTVVPVANNPVQGGPFQGEYPARVEGEFTTFSFDLFTTYPNPLAGDDRFLPYSPNPIYQAAELFKLTVPTADLRDPNCTTVSKLILAWDRIGPWLPWMQMGDRPGQLIYSSIGRKVFDFKDLPELLQEQIDTHMPIYRHAPAAELDCDNVTSWTYFRQHFDAYLAGAQFPIPQTAEPAPFLKPDKQ